MRIYEILKQKTEKEIWDRIIDLSPTEMLIASAFGGFIKGVPQYIYNHYVNTMSPLKGNKKSHQKNMTYISHIFR